jgi:hypothetical protein
MRYITNPGYLRAVLILVIAASTLTACEKEITVDLPTTDPRVVVEGTIETGQAPLVILSRTQGFFDPTSVESIAGSFISEATVQVFDGTTMHVLDRVCSSLIPDSLLEEAAALTGIDVSLLANANICVWTKLDNSILGVDGRTYRLEVETEGRSLRSTTTIPISTGADSLWFKLAQQQPNDDSLGFIWARIVDPDTLGNHYRWMAQRLNAGPDGDPKDDGYIAPFFSVYEDRFVNGLTFDFSFARGSYEFSTAEDDENEERGYFKRGDTVAVKFINLGRAEFLFYNSFQNNAATQGDVFSTPTNIISNIEGGLGVWAGYGIRLDTVVCVP